MLPCRFRICKKDYHMSARCSNPGERAPTVRYQSQITLIITTAGCGCDGEDAKREIKTYLLSFVYQSNPNPGGMASSQMPSTSLGRARLTFGSRVTALRATADA